jgi:diaminohydroxyphosphoribosylaminopyrimidine deaminase/5-amino-6-(5-phosphoribosylamino)uracil reductase
VAAATDSAVSARDPYFMRAALALARRGLGNVWPNPAVGCVLVRPELGGRVVGRGWTQPGGRPHAETEALRRAGEVARGATAYVTLEPCDHHGQTPPCSRALVEAGVARAVVAIEDPDPRVAGRGLKTLADAGVAVALGTCAEEAAEINAGFLLRVKEGRPLFTLKTATTLDGRIATRTGESRWITGERARARAHKLRAEHDAILIGVGTALADDPELTCRLPGLEARSPLRIVLDSHARLSPTSRLAASARIVPTWLVTIVGADRGRVQALATCGVEIIEVSADPNRRPDVRALAADLGRRGLTRVLIEGGSEVAAAFLGAGLVDRLAWFRAPMMVGDGVPAAADFAVATLADAPRWARIASQEAGEDIVEYYRRVN